MTDADQYDEQPAEDVFQTEDFSPSVVPVSVEGVVRTDEMPSRCYFKTLILKTGANAELVLPADPRRKRVILWANTLGAGVESVVIGENQSVVQAFLGAHLMFGNVPLRYEISTREEIWARPCVIDATSGTFTGFSVSTDDAILSFIIEQWTQ